jgi:hypothetical protein
LIFGIFGIEIVNCAETATAANNTSVISVAEKMKCFDMIFLLTCTVKKNPAKHFTWPRRQQFKWYTTPEVPEWC